MVFCGGQRDPCVWDAARLSEQKHSPAARKVSQQPACIDHAILYRKPFGIPLILYTCFKSVSQGVENSDAHMRVMKNGTKYERKVGRDHMKDERIFPTEVWLVSWQQIVAPTFASNIWNAANVPSSSLPTFLLRWICIKSSNPKSDRLHTVYTYLHLTRTLQKHWGLVEQRPDEVLVYKQINNNVTVKWGWELCPSQTSTRVAWDLRRVEKQEFAWDFSQLSCHSQTRTRVAWTLTSESLHESFLISRVLVKREQELHES